MKAIKGEEPFRMVAMASAMAFLPLAGYALYASSKAPLNAVATAYRHELPANQKLQLVYPIATRTAFFKTAGDSPVPWPSQTADEVALKVIDGIIKDRDTIIPSIIYDDFLIFPQMSNFGSLPGKAGGLPFINYLVR